MWKSRPTFEKFALISIACLFSVLLFLSIYFQYVEKNNSATVINLEELVRYAKLFLEDHEKEKSGKWLDCSGFTKIVYKESSVRIPLTSFEQFSRYGGLNLKELRRGDLVFFNTSGKRVSHVGIYIDKNLFIHSPGYAKFVRIDSLTHSYYKKCFISGGRVIFNK